MKHLHKNKFLTFILSFIALMVSLMVGFSTFYIKNDTPITNSGTSNVNDNITISLKYYAYLGRTETYGEKKYKDGYGTESSPIDSGFAGTKSATEYNKIINLYKDLSGISVSELAEDTYTFFNDEGTLKTTIVITRDVSKADIPIFGTRYYYGFYVYTEEIFYVDSSDDFGNEIMSTISIPANSILTVNTLYNFLELDFNEYALIGLAYESNGSISSNYYDFKTKLLSDTTMYVILNKKSDTNIKLDLTSAVNDNTGNLKVYRNPTNNDFNVVNDYTYSQVNKTILLGDKNRTTTIKSGTSVDLCLDNGALYVEAAVGTSVNNKTPKENDSYRCYTVVLCNDLIINGTLNVGSSFGSGANSGIQGEINGSFVKIDLNGHNIIINEAGTLNLYGVIENSCDNGQLIMNGAGSFKTLMVIFDYKGGTSTLESADNDVCPFQIYNLPYLRCNFILKYNNGWGKVYAVTRIHPAASNILFGDPSATMIFNFLGPSNENFLFELENGQNNDSFVLFEYKREGINTNGLSTTEINTIGNWCLDTKTIVTFNSVNCLIGYLQLDIKVFIEKTYYSYNFNFPLSSYFNLNFINSTLTFSQALQLMPGFMATFDKDSSLVFSYESKRCAQLNVLNKPLYYYDNETSSLITKNTISGSSMSDSYWKSALYWKYNQTAIVNIYGNLIFKSGNSFDYVLSGEININNDKVGYLDSSSNIVFNTNYDNPFEFIKKSSINVKTYNYDYIAGIYDSSKPNNLRVYTVPLISYDVAYIHDSNKSLVGIYESNTGLF